MTAAKNQKRHPLPRLGVFGQPELPTTQAAPGRVRWAALAALLAVCLVCYNYTDLPLIVRHSISLWDALRTYTAVYSGEMNLRWMLAGRLKPWSREGDALVNLLSRLSEGALQNTDALLMAVLVLAVGGMLVLYAPWRADRPQREGSLAVDGGTLWARFALSAAVALAPLLLYLVG